MRRLVTTTLVVALAAAGCVQFDDSRVGAPAEGPALEGAWRTTLRFKDGAFAGFKDLEFMYVFNLGGTLTESSNYDGAPPVPPAYGVWRRLGRGEFEAKYEYYATKAPARFDEIAKRRWVASVRPGSLHRAHRRVRRRQEPHFHASATRLWISRASRPRGAEKRKVAASGSASRSTRAPAPCRDEVGVRTARLRDLPAQAEQRLQRDLAGRASHRPGRQRAAGIDVELIDDSRARRRRARSDRTHPPGAACARRRRTAACSGRSTFAKRDRRVLRGRDAASSRVRSTTSRSLTGQGARVRL